METVHPYLVLLLVLVRVRVVPHWLLAPRLFQFVGALAVPEQPRGQAHGFPQILQRLLDFDALLLDQVVLHILEFHKHFLRVGLPLLQLLVPVFLDTFQVCQQCDFLVLLQCLLSLLDPPSNVDRLLLLLLLLQSVGQYFDLLSLPEALEEGDRPEEQGKDVGQTTRLQPG